MDWTATLAQLALDADMSTCTPADLQVHRWITGCSDARLQAKFLRVENPTIANLQALAHAHEAANETLKQLEKGKAAAANAAQAKSGKSGGSKGQGGGKQQQNRSSSSRDSSRKSRKRRRNPSVTDAERTTTGPSAPSRSRTPTALSVTRMGILQQPVAFSQSRNSSAEDQHRGETSRTTGRSLPAPRVSHTPTPTASL